MNYVQLPRPSTASGRNPAAFSTPSRSFTAAMSPSFLLGVPVLFVTLLVACDPGRRLVARQPLDSDSPSRRLAFAPIIAVGTIVRNTKVIQFQGANWDEDTAGQLNRVTVHIEKVLRGNVRDSNIPVYYFGYGRRLDGPPGLGMAGTGGRWRIGDREIFFLRPDSGLLRTSCDFAQRCVTPLATGEHPGFHFEPGKPLAESIIDLLLTRGQNCTDEQMKKAMASGDAEGFSLDYTVKRLQQIAATEVPTVSNEACETLAYFEHPCVTHTPEPPGHRTSLR